MMSPVVNIDLKLGTWIVNTLVGLLELECTPLANVTALCDILYKRLRNTLTYLLTYLKK